MFSNDRSHTNQVNLFIYVPQTLQDELRQFNGNLSEKWLKLIVTFVMSLSVRVSSKLR